MKQCFIKKSTLYNIVQVEHYVGKEWIHNNLHSKGYIIKKNVECHAYEVLFELIHNNFKT